MREALIALRAKQGIVDPDTLSGKSKKLYDTMSEKELASFAGVKIPRATEPLAINTPPSPETLVGAKHDTVHKTLGKGRPAKSTKAKKSKKKYVRNTDDLPKVPDPEPIIVKGSIKIVDEDSEL